MGKLGRLKHVKPVAKPKHSACNDHIGICDKCGLPFNNAKKYSEKNESWFVPKTCVSCWRKREAAKYRIAPSTGYCRNCGWFLMSAGPNAVLKQIYQNGRWVELHNYCRYRRAQPAGGIGVFHDDKFQDGVPCKTWSPISMATALGNE